jgi:hypothetical protein
MKERKMSVYALILLSAMAIIRFAWGETLENECEREFAISIKYQLVSAAPGKLSISFHKANHNGYELNLNADASHRKCHISLVKRKGEALHVLGVSYSKLEVGSEHQNELIIRYWYGKVKVIHNKRLLFVRYDDEFTSGMATYSASGSVKVVEARYQPTEAILFADDFLRGSEDVQHWEKVYGTWVPVGADSSKFNPRLSANPFSMQAISTSNALALAGYWFWDDYSFKAAVRPRSDSGSVGLVVYARDGTNYLLFRWGSALENGKQQIIAVEDGRTNVLAEKDGGFVPMQWYQIEVRVCDDRITALIDGVQTLSARCDFFGMGKVGLYADGKMIAQFDDVCVESWGQFSETFDEPLLGRWETISGNWNMSSNSLRIDGGKATPKPHWIATGSSAWKDYTVSILFTAKGAAVGVGVYFKDTSNTYLVRCAPPRTKVSYEGKCQIVRIANGVTTVLAEAPFDLPKTQLSKLTVDACDGLIRVSLNENELLKAFDTTHTSGKVALYHEGSGEAVFKGVFVRFGSIRRLIIPSIAAQFTRESTMVQWATPVGAWQQVGNAYWHRGNFYGVSFVRYTLPSEKSFKDAIALVLKGDGKDQNSGYRLVVDGEKDSSISVELFRADKSVAKRDIPKEREEPMNVELHCDGGLLFATYDGKPLFSFVDRAPLSGTKVGIIPLRGSIDFDLVKVASDHMVDCTFSNAPVEWWAVRGAWEVTERWTCSPEWSFFGGKDSRSPILMSKRSFGGDIVVEAYVSIRMHGEGYNYPGDLNISICTDGLNLDSGYSFVFAGWSNTCSRILKGAKVLAERSDELGKLTKPMQNYHRYWWYLRVEKCGKKLRMFVDDALVLEAEDDNPIDSGHVALWTVNKGINVGRVRIWYEREATSKPINEVVRPIISVARASEKLIAETAKQEQLQLPAKFDFESQLPKLELRLDEDNQVMVMLDTTTAVSGKRSLKVVNAITGGRFEITLLKAEFDASKAPILRFAYRLQPDVKVDMFVRSLGRTFYINFSGNAIRQDHPMLLGRVEGVVSDGKWHVAEFNLAEALAAKFGRRDSLIVHEIGFANFSSDPYLFAGIGGNHFGTSFNIDDVALIQPQQHASAK